MKQELFLPIGSVVKLKGAEKRVMIYGIMQVASNEEEKKIYDYVGVIYPEGNVSPEDQLFFNEDDIERIDFYGFSDYERQEFMEEVKESFLKEESNHVESK